MFTWNRKKVPDVTTRLSLFEQRLEVLKAPLNSFFTSVLTRFNLTENADRFYKEGHDNFPFIDFDRYNSHIQNSISVLFETAKGDLVCLEKRIECEIDIMIEQLNSESKIVENNLDVTFVTGELFILDTKIKDLEQREKDLQTIAFPEVELQEIVAKALKQQRDAMSDVKTQSNDSDKLSAIIEQKEAFGLGGYLLKNFSSIIHSTGTIRHSFLFPPKKKFIHALYFLCSILAVAEIGFSAQIIQGIMKVNVNQGMLPAGAYAIGITISFAVIQKCLIELVLQRGNRGQYWTATISIAFVLVLLFSFPDNRDSNTDWQKIIHKGFLLGFFSISFALANAFLFREASYLHHLQHRLYDGTSLETLRSERIKCFKLWKAQQLTCQNLTMRLEIQKADFRSNIIPKISDQLTKLEQVCIESFNKGMKMREEEIVKNNHELEVELIAKYKVRYL